MWENVSEILTMRTELSQIGSTTRSSFSLLIPTFNRFGQFPTERNKNQIHITHLRMNLNPLHLRQIKNNFCPGS